MPFSDYTAFEVEHPFFMFKTAMICNRLELPGGIRVMPKKLIKNDHERFTIETDEGDIKGVTLANLDLANSQAVLSLLFGHGVIKCNIDFNGTEHPTHFAGFGEQKLYERKAIEHRNRALEAEFDRFLPDGSLSKHLDEERDARHQGIVGHLRSGRGVWKPRERRKLPEMAYRHDSGKPGIYDPDDYNEYNDESEYSTTIEDSDE